MYAEEKTYIVQPKQQGAIYAPGPTGAAVQWREMMKDPRGEVLEVLVWEEGAHGEEVGDPVEVVIFHDGESAMLKEKWDEMQAEVRTLYRPTAAHVSQELRSAIGSLDEIPAPGYVVDMIRPIMAHLERIDEMVGSLGND